MTDPIDFKFTHDHEWVQILGDTIRVGVSDYIQAKLSGTFVKFLKPLGT